MISRLKDLIGQPWVLGLNALLTLFVNFFAIIFAIIPEDKNHSIGDGSVYIGDSGEAKNITTNVTKNQYSGLGEEQTNQIIDEIQKNREGVKRELILALLDRMGEQATLLNNQQLYDILTQKIDHLLEIEKKFSALDSDDPKVSRLRIEAGKAAQNGDIERAQSLLDEAIMIDTNSARQQRDNAIKKFISAAQTSKQKAESWEIFFQYDQAAISYEQSAALYKEAGDDQNSIEMTIQRADALAQYGSKRGVNSALVTAIEIYQNVLKEDEFPPEKNGRLLNNLGNALQTLGARESGTERLEQAVEAHQQALKEYTRERVPLDWAGTQNNLGNTLQTLGAREGGTERLEQAVEAYQQALKELSRERTPLDWAITQYNLGDALQTLGERQTGTERLEQAAEAFEASLTVLDETKSGYYFSIVQNNLKNTRQMISSRKYKRIN